MERVFSLGLMEDFIKEGTKMTRKQVMECLVGE
jgi:hypothetical protein